MPKAYVCTRHGGPETKACAEADPPVPGPGELLAAVRTAGADPVDRRPRIGIRRPGEGEARFPVVVGGKAAGVVEETGKIVIEVAI
ncbi:hypothetical protein [Streptomyces sp. NPDC058457]|uniref:hypothetical protein n=1 Tax=Streptomyces sp. NPDC058457 TaxID=3346507 RepID=UPI0036641902